MTYFCRDITSPAERTCTSLQSLLPPGKSLSSHLAVEAPQPPHHENTHVRTSQSRPVNTSECLTWGWLLPGKHSHGVRGGLRVRAGPANTAVRTQAVLAQVIHLVKPVLAQELAKHNCGSVSQEPPPNTKATQRMTLVACATAVMSLPSRESGQ